MDETSNDGDAPTDNQKHSLGWKALIVSVIAVAFCLTAAWLVLVARGVLLLLEWVFQ